MSERRLRRKSSSRRSSSRRQSRRRRRSNASMTSWNSTARSDVFGDEEDEEMIRRFADDDDDDDDNDDDRYDDDDDDERGKRRRHRRRQSSRRSRSSRRKSKREGRKSKREDEEEKEDEEGEEMTEEMILEKINRCKELIESVKMQTWKMSKKMKVLKKARAYVETFEGKLSRSRGYQQRWKQLNKQIQRLWVNLIAALLPWEMRIKTIESHFGSVVASYFIFLRWLIWISVWLAVLPLCFIILPELIEGEDHGSSLRKTVPEIEKKNEHDLKTIWDAEGVVKYSLMFYGYYGNAEKFGKGYRLPLAYLMTSLVAFAYSFVVVLKTMANNSRQSRLSTTDDEFTFSWKLFTEWDFMIESNETATTKRASIVTTFKEAILEEQEKVREGNKYVLIVLRVLANFLVVILLALSAYVIQLFVERSREMELLKRQDPEYEAGFWAENELTVIMTLISTLFPNILDLVSVMEKYHPRTSLRVMLARIFVLNLLNLYTLFIALYNKQNDLLASIEQAKQNGTYVIQSNCTSMTVTSNVTSALNPDTTESSTAAATSTASSLLLDNVYNNVTSSPAYVTLCTNHTSNMAATSLENDLCWETMIGQETFKLTVMDTVFVLGQIVIIDVFRSHFIKHCSSLCCWDLERTFPEYPDFKTAENLLHLISNQGTIWLGAFFAPGLPLLNLLKLVIMLYVRCWTVMTYNAPQERIFRASRSSNFYFALLLVMLFLCMLPPLFAIVAIDPSPNCGPFSGQSKIYHILTSTMDSELPESVNTFIEYLASPGVILPVFMLLGMTIYYLVSMGRSLREANRQLTMQLEYERTEGRRKVYAMADAKNDNQPKPGVKGWQNVKVKVLESQQKMAHAAFSIISEMKAKSEANGIAKKPRERTAAAERIQAVARKQNMASKMLRVAVANNRASKATPSIPVAIVKGKQSVKVNAAGSRDRAKNRLRAAFQESPSAKPRHDDNDRNDVTTSDRKRRNGRWPRRQEHGRHLRTRDRDEIREIEHDEEEEDNEISEGDEDADEAEEIDSRVHRHDNDDDDGDGDDDHDDDDGNDEEEEEEETRVSVKNAINKRRGKRKEDNDIETTSSGHRTAKNQTKKAVITSSPQPPPPPPPPVPSSKAGSSRSSNVDSQNSKVEAGNSGGGSILDRIKMFQGNNGNNNNSSSSSNNNRNPSSVKDKGNDGQTSNKHSKLTNAESSKEGKPTQRLRSNHTEKKIRAGPSQKSNTKYEKGNVKSKSTPKVRGKQAKSIGISDAKGNLIPYDNSDKDEDDDDDNENDEESGSNDDADGGGDENITDDQNSTPAVISKRLLQTNGLKTALTKNGSKAAPKDNQSSSSKSPKNNPPIKKETAGSSQTQPQTQSERTSAVQKGSKVKHAHHQRVVEAEIEIVNEKKQPAWRKKKVGSLGGGGQQKGKGKKTRDSDSHSGPVPSIKIEDFSDKSVDKPDEINDDEDDDSPSGKTTRMKVTTETGRSEPKAGSSKEEDEEEDEPAEENGQNEEEKIETDATPKRHSIKSIMKSKGRLAKWRRIAFGLRRKNKSDLKGNGKTTRSIVEKKNTNNGTLGDTAAAVGENALAKSINNSLKSTTTNAVTNNNNNNNSSNRKTTTINEGIPTSREESSTAAVSQDKEQINYRHGRLHRERYPSPVIDYDNNTGTRLNNNNNNNNTNSLMTGRSNQQVPSPSIDYPSDDDVFDISDTDAQDELAKRRRRAFLQKRASLASIRSDRPSVIGDSSDNEESDARLEEEGAGTSAAAAATRVKPQVRQRADHSRRPITEVIRQSRDGDVIIGITNARLEIGSEEE